MPTPDITERMAKGASGRRAGLPARLLWFAGIWFLSVAVMGSVAYAIRWAIHGSG